VTETRRLTVAIIGASRDRGKFGNKSVRAHRAHGYNVFPVNPSAAEIEGLRAYPSLRAVPVERLDRVSVYVPPEVGIALLGEIAAAAPRELWFNPGSESPALIERARELGLQPIVACSIVDVEMYGTERREP
jgi:predicted CoA-binding protein